MDPARDKKLKLLVQWAYVSAEVPYLNIADALKENISNTEGPANFSADIDSGEAILSEPIHSHSRAKTIERVKTINSTVSLKVTNYKAKTSECSA